jgi:esterase FrsA
MPGTYAYKNPMSASSEAIYSGVMHHFANHPRVDAKRIAMVGVSFGAYWSARMAAVNPRLSCAVVCGAPLHYAFGGASFLGTPEIIASVLMKVAGAKNLKSLDEKLSDLSFVKNDLYRRITCPLLVINGDNDTLLGTKDSEVLAMKASKGFLKLYENDDHCAMGHYQEWLDLSFEWLNIQFKS